MLRDRDRPRLWRAAFAVTGWAALALQYLLMVGPAEGWTVVTRTVQYFSFFTILANILVAAAFTGPLLKPTRGGAQWTARPDVRAAAATYIVIVAAVYHLLIAPYWRPQGLTFGVNVVLHYLTPAAFVLDWLWFTPRGGLRWTDPLRWLAFPLAFGAWTLIHGLTTHWWPYGFVDVDALGLGRVLTVFAALLTVFVAVGLAFVGLDKALGRTRRDRSAPAL